LYVYNGIDSMKRLTDLTVGGDAPGKYGDGVIAVHLNYYNNNLYFMGKTSNSNYNFSCWKYVIAGDSVESVMIAPMSRGAVYHNKLYYSGPSGSKFNCLLTYDVSNGI